MILDIWAFVRVMVALEKRAEEPTCQALYSLWEQEWMEIDERLTTLADGDFDAYADMMMHKQIKLELPPEQAAAFQQVVKELVADLRREKRASKDRDFQKDLTFEIEGLARLL